MRGTMCKRSCCSYTSIVVRSRPLARTPFSQSSAASATVIERDAGTCTPLATSTRTDASNSLASFLVRNVLMARLCFPRLSRSVSE